MPEAAFDVKAYAEEILKGATVPEEKRKVFEEVLGMEAVSKNAQAAGLRQSDYSRRMNELKKEQDAIQAKVEEANQEYETKMQGLSKWEKEAKDLLAKKDAELAKLGKRSRNLETQLAKAKEDFGFEPDLDEDAPPPRKAAGAPEVDLEQFKGQFLTKKDFDDFQKQTGEVYAAMAKYPIQLQALSAEHFRLFGEVLDIAPIYDEHVKSKYRKPMDEIWAEKYKVPEKRQAIAAAALEKQQKEWLEKGRLQGIQEATRPPGSPEPDQLASPVLKFAAKQREKAGEPALSSVDRATQKFMERRRKAG